MWPCTMPHWSLTALSTGTMALVVQEAHESSRSSSSDQVRVDAGDDVS